MTLSKSTTAMLQSYGRSFIGAALALYLTGSTDWQDYVYALVAAFAPVAIRYFNKNDIAFGRISGNSTPADLATEAVKTLEKVVKAKPVAKVPAAKKASSPAKKSTAKKATSK
jgi:hypothetical protein